MAETTVTFVKAPTTVTLPAPLPGSPIREIKHQASFLLASGDRVVYDKGVDRYEIDLEFESLTEAELDDLQAFFHTTTDGVVETWTYNDSNGAAHTARFLDPVLDFTKTAYNVYDVMVKLELADFPK